MNNTLCPKCNQGHMKIVMEERINSYIWTEYKCDYCQFSYQDRKQDKEQDKEHDKEQEILPSNDRFDLLIQLLFAIFNETIEPNTLGSRIKYDALQRAYKNILKEN